MKRTISILLSLIMVLSIFTIVPLSASADETRYFEYKVLGDGTAEITGYTGISSFIDIPSVINGLTVISIGDWAFNGYDRMTEVTIPDTVTNIGEGAFWECKGLTEVFIPDSVTSISDSAFYDCTSLMRFKVAADNPFYRSLNGDLYDKSAATLIQYASGKTATSFTIPDSVINIKEGTFIFSCLTEITVPKSVRNIDDYAIGYYYNNNHMPAPIDGFVIKGFVGTAAKLYATDNEITFVALEKDPNNDYEYRVLDDGTAEITRYKGNGGDIEIPSTLGGHIVTSIGLSAFSGCGSLTEVTIPDSVINIGDNAFYNCSKITEVTIPDSVTSIGERAFSYCSSLTSITVDSNNPNYRSIDGNLYDKSAETLIQYASGKTTTSFIIPDSVTTIGNYAFAWCGITKATIPNSVTNIGNHAFYQCRLTEVTIPDSVKTIGNATFYNCINLTKVTIGNSVTTIGDNAFRECHSLTELTIGNSVTTIGDNAFRECHSLTELTIGNSVTSIGGNAFFYCENLSKVIIPDSVTVIGIAAFSYCWSLSDLTIGSSVTSIGRYAFVGCRLTEVTIPDSVKTISDYSFGYSDGSVIYYSLLEKKDDFTIKGYHGTAAEKYANDNGFTFIALYDSLLGDVDNDNVVGIIDTTYIQRYNAGFRIPVSEEDMLARGDVDSDGEVGVIDSTYIQRYDAGFNTPYPIGEAMN